MSFRSPSYLIDLHVHTRAYSPCAELLDPFALDELMLKRGIHGIVLAEHDAIWPDAELARLRRHLTGERRIYSGIEVSCREGHFVAIGFDRSEGLKPGMALAELLEIVQAQGGVVVWAHPFRPAKVGALCMNPEDAPGRLDAVEIFSSVTTGESSAALWKIAVRRQWRTVGGSDAHAPETVGRAVTGFSTLPEDEKALADSVRNSTVTAVQMPPRTMES